MEMKHWFYVYHFAANKANQCLQLTTNRSIQLVTPTLQLHECAKTVAFYTIEYLYLFKIMNNRPSE
jgi:hypothetical protein